jgi:hypothetical protein
MVDLCMIAERTPKHQRTPIAERTPKHQRTPLTTTFLRRKDRVEYQR